MDHCVQQRGIENAGLTFRNKQNLDIYKKEEEVGKEWRIL
jgi:hypothetical protein